VIAQGLHGLRGEQVFYVLEGGLTVRVGPQNSTNDSWPLLQLLYQATGSGIMTVV
jgi:hypothetical protein